MLYIRRPCITVRDQTEMVETLQKGYNILAKPETTELFEKIQNAEIKDYKKVNYYGNGNAGEEIVNILEEM